MPVDGPKKQPTEIEKTSGQRKRARPKSPVTTPRPTMIVAFVVEGECEDGEGEGERSGRD